MKMKRTAIAGAVALALTSIGGAVAFARTSAPGPGNQATSEPTDAPDTDHIQEGDQNGAENAAEESLGEHETGSEDPEGHEDPPGQVDHLDGNAG